MFYLLRPLVPCYDVLFLCFHTSYLRPRQKQLYSRIDKLSLLSQNLHLIFAVSLRDLLSLPHLLHLTLFNAIFSPQFFISYVHFRNLNSEIYNSWPFLFFILHILDPDKLLMSCPVYCFVSVFLRFVWSKTMVTRACTL